MCVYIGSIFLLPLAAWAFLENHQHRTEILLTLIDTNKELSAMKVHFAVQMKDRYSLDVWELWETEKEGHMPYKVRLGLFLFFGGEMLYVTVCILVWGIILWNISGFSNYVPPDLNMYNGTDIIWFHLYLWCVCVCGGRRVAHLFLMWRICLFSLMILNMFLDKQR